MFRKVISLAWKDTLLRFSSRTEILFFLILPLAFTTVLAGGIPDDGDNQSPLALPVIDNDGGPMAQDLLATLESDGAITTQVLTPDAAQTAFDEEAPALLTIPSGFSAAALQGQAVELAVRLKPSDMNASAVEQALAGATAGLGRPLAIAHFSTRQAEQQQPFESESARQEYFEAALQAARQSLQASATRLEITGPAADDLQAKSTYNTAAHASAGQLITWVFIPLVGASGLFVYERQHGTLRRLVTTPTRKLTFLLGSMGGQLGQGLVQMAILTAFGGLALGVTWGQSPLALALLLTAFGLAAVALGIMLGTFVKSVDQATNISIMSGMAMALLGGCWFPMEFFPEGAQTAVKVLPTTWAMQGLSDLALRGEGLAAVLPEIAALLGFAVLFLSVGVWRFRYE
jgi:ABC-2 type transport system permease protein